MSTPSVQARARALLAAWRAELHRSYVVHGMTPVTYADPDVARDIAELGEVLAALSQGAPEGRAVATSGGWISVDDAHKPAPRTVILVAVEWMKRGEDDDGRPFEQTGYTVTEGEWIGPSEHGSGYFDSFLAPHGDGWGVTHWMWLPQHPQATQPAPSRDSTPTVYVEARQCEDCNHIGINDEHETASACSECRWQGPRPTEDICCPGCGERGTMSAACPECGGRYDLLASEHVPARDCDSTKLVGYIGSHGEILASTYYAGEPLKQGDKVYVLSPPSSNSGAEGVSDYVRSAPERIWLNVFADIEYVRADLATSAAREATAQPAGAKP